MCFAPSPSAWSRKALNLISALHSTSGLGVRPAEYSARKAPKTRSLYSAEKFTASSSMPITSATEAQSMRSCRVEQYSSSSSSSQFFMKRPTTSKPRRFRRSEEHTSELQSHVNLVCRLLLEKKKHNLDLFRRNEAYNTQLADK